LLRLMPALVLALVMPGLLAAQVRALQATLLDWHRGHHHYCQNLGRSLYRHCCHW
jgi:hypothetical protein